MVGTHRGCRRRPVLVGIALVAAVLLPAGQGWSQGGTATDDVVARRVRVVVQLADTPLASYRDIIPGLRGVLAARTPDQHLDVGAPASQAYLRYLADRHRAFEAALAQVAPDARVQWRYRIATNGLTLEVDEDRLDAVRALPGAVAVTETYPMEPELDASRQLLDPENAFFDTVPGGGRGRRVALIDTGVNPSHPFFDPSGYEAPAGYPRAERVAGGERTPLPQDVYASNKVIVGSVYARPGNSSATPYGSGSFHGTHVAGILAGVSGKYNYSSGSKTFELPLAGMAPEAYVMSYSLAGDSAEFLAAVDDVVADMADSLNISLGHSRWLTTDIVHDPVRRALDAAVDAGTVVAASAGNAGANGDSSVTGAWKMSAKLITVASSTHARVFSNAVSVTGPGTPPDNLKRRVGVPGAPPAPPVETTISGVYAVAPGGNGGDAGRACTALPPGSLAGRIAVVSRGDCTFDTKKNNVAAAGATAMIVHNNSDDPPIVMGGFTPPALPAVMVSRTDGRGLVGWAATSSSPTVAIEGPVNRLTSGWPDVVSGFSSRGPAPNMAVKPDVAAPGANVLSSIVDAAGNVTPPFFEQLSGTSMATPHVAGLAAATKALHLAWTPAQVRSAIVNTAETTVHLDTAASVPALAKHRGGGRVRPPGLVAPHLTFEATSIGFGLVPAGETASALVMASDMRAEGAPSTSFSVSVRPVVGHPAVSVAVTPGFSSAGGATSVFEARVATTGAPAGDYEGFVEVAGGGQRFTIPYFVRVQDPTVAKDVLLIDWDRSGSTTGPADYRAVHTAALDALGLTYDVFDGGFLTGAAANRGPTLTLLQNYRAVVLYTGDNFTSWSSAHTGGSFALQNYLIGGGRLLLLGQDLASGRAFNQNVGADYNVTTMAGWVTGEREDGACSNATNDRDLYGPLVLPAERLLTQFTLLGGAGDVSVNTGGSGAQNQRFPDAGRAVVADDASGCALLYNAVHLARHARVLGEYTKTERSGAAVETMTRAVATGVAPDRTLEDTDPDVSWSAALLHVGLEGLNAGASGTTTLTVAEALRRLHGFLTDRLSVAVSAKTTASRVELVATALSSRGAPITRYRWDFGDGSPVLETAGNHVVRELDRGTYSVRVQAIDALTRSDVASTTVRVRKKRA